MGCDSCGRTDGHWLGCRATRKSPEAGDGVVTFDVFHECARKGCTSERAPQGKGPRPKFCIEHKTGSK